MKSKGKLGNDEKVKFVGPEKVSEGEKTCEPQDIYVNYHFHFLHPFSFLSSIQPNGPL